MTIASGLPKMNGSQVTGSIWAANGISFSNPGTQNDAGWIRVTGSGESDTLLEIATGDDGASDFNIAFRGYNTSNNVVYDVRIPKKSGTLTTLDSVYPIGSVYFSTINTNPSAYFGGTWSLIGNKLAVSENVFGNGKALAITDGTTLGGFTGFGGSPSTTQMLDGIYSRNIGVSRYNYSGNSLKRDVIIGAPTKSQLGSNLSNSGLIVDTVTIYSWKRTA